MEKKESIWLIKNVLRAGKLFYAPSTEVLNLLNAENLS